MYAVTEAHIGTWAKKATRDPKLDSDVVPYLTF